MTVPLILVLVAPVAAAVLSPVFWEVPLQRRVLVGACAAAAVGGAAYGLVRTIAGSPVAWRGFAMDPWRGLLVCGALLSAVGAGARADGRSRGSLSQAAVFGAVAAMIVPLVVASSHLLVVGLLAGTAGFAVAAFAVAEGGGRSLRVARATTALVASDALACAAIGTSLGGGTALPPHLSTIAGALMLAAATIRLGLAPLAGPADDANGTDPALGLLWDGPVRAQGFLLALMAIGSGRGIAHAAAAIAALSILASASGVVRRDGGGSLAAIATGVALLGFALGGAPAAWGATLATAAAFASWVAWRAGETWSSAARASLTAAPAGALLAGATLVAGAGLDAGAERPWFLALAVPALAGLLATFAFVWSAASRDGRGSAAVALPASIAIAVCLALAALPARAASGLGLPVASALGIGRLLSAGARPGIPDTVAVLALAAAAVGFAAGPGKLGSGGAPIRRKEASGAFSWWAASPPSSHGRSMIAAERADEVARRWAMTAAVLFAAALGLGLRVYIVAAGRGFL